VLEPEFPPELLDLLELHALSSTPAATAAVVKTIARVRIGGHALPKVWASWPRRNWECFGREHIPAQALVTAIDADSLRDHEFSCELTARPRHARFRVVGDWSEATAEGGQKFVYRDSGDGPVVVLLHGFPDTPHGWDAIAGALVAAGYRAIRPWLRGYHPATVSGRKYDALTIAQDPVLLLDALGVERAVLIGHDWGAAVTWGAAAVAPERWRAIVPIAIPHTSLLPRDPKTLWGARHFAGFKMPWAERMTRMNDFHYIDSLYSRWAPTWSGPDRDACVANYKECVRDPIALKGSIDYYRALSPKPPRELHKVPQLRGLVVGGTDDLVPPHLFGKSAERMADGSRSLIVENAGHWPHREGEELFTRTLIEFLADTQ